MEEEKINDDTNIQLPLGTNPFKKEVINQSITSEESAANNTNLDPADNYYFPANLAALNLDDVISEQSAWLLVKRPWKPTDAQMTKDQIKARAKKEEKKAALLKEWESSKMQQRQQQQGGNAFSGTDFFPDYEEEEPGANPNEEDDKFHYYWRLSNPGIYEEAGAVGNRWRAIRFDMAWTSQHVYDRQVFTGSGTLHWIKESNWKIEQKTRIRKNVLIYKPDFSMTGRTLEDVKIAEKIGHSIVKKNASDAWDFLEELITKDWANDGALQDEAQLAATGDKLIENHGSTDPLPFRYKDGTFAISKGALDNLPTRNASTDRLYVRLRSKTASTLEVSGGRLTFTRGDVFILKEKLDRLSDLKELELDPTRPQIEQNTWGSDPRSQKTAIQDEKEEKAKLNKGKKNHEVTIKPKKVSEYTIVSDTVETGRASNG